MGAMAGRRVNKDGWARANCPLCEMRLDKPDKKQCLGLHVTSGKWHCFRCGARGKLHQPEEFELWRPPSSNDERKALQAMQPPEGYYPLFEEPGLSSEVFAMARDYITRPMPQKGRGLAAAIARTAKIGFTMQGKFAGRVIVPILAPDRKTWFGWSGRHLDEQAERKYLYPSGMNRGELLYNHAALLRKTDEPVIAVEGVFDALAFWPNAVAVLGKFSEQQLEAFKASPRPVCIVLDGDAWREAWITTARLRFEGKRAGFIRMPPKKDPDEMVDWVKAQVDASIEQEL